MVSDEMASKRRSESACDEQGKAPPHANSRLVLAVLRTVIGQGPGPLLPVLPIQRYGLSTPLRLEAIVRALPSTASEVEPAVAALAPETEALPIEQHVCADSIVGSETGCPGNVEA